MRKHEAMAIDLRAAQVQRESSKKSKIERIARTIRYNLDDEDFTAAILYMRYSETDPADIAAALKMAGVRIAINGRFVSIVHKHDHH